MAFSGPALGFNFFLGARYGASYSRVQLGAARSTGGWSAAEGLGMTLGPGLGRSEVTDIRWEECSCGN